MIKNISHAVLLTLIMFNAYPQGIKVKNAHNEQSCKEMKQSYSTKKIDLAHIKYPTISQKFMEARKNNKENLRRASKFYNPLTIIFHLFRI